MTKDGDGRGRQLTAPASLRVLERRQETLRRAAEADRRAACAPRITHENADALLLDLNRSKHGRVQDLLNKIVDRARVQTVITQLRQARINAAQKQLETRVAEGIGEHVARIDTGAFFMMRNIHGAQCWHDPDFVKAFMRDNPACRLRLHTRKYFNGWTAENAQRSTSNIQLSEMQR